MNDQQLQPTTAQAYLTAERDAESDAKKVTWFFIGFLGNILGILIASIYESTPPASRLLGESPEHAALYTDSYKAKSRKIQIRQSIIGCVVPVGFMIFIWILMGIFTFFT